MLVLSLLWAQRTFATARAGSITIVTPTPSLAPEAESTLTSTPIPSSVQATQVALPSVTAGPALPREPGRRAKREVFLTPTPTLTSISAQRHQVPQHRPTGTVTSPAGRHLHHRRRRTPGPRTTPSPTATPTPTATPPISLNIEDSVAPVTCNGPTKTATRRPFLFPPYKGWTNLVSYFDHDLPNFSRNGRIVAAPDFQAQADTNHRRSDFPGYWNRRLRQYLYYDGHNGYDYDLRYQPVHAAAPGKVIFARFEYPTAPDHGYGKMVMIDHQNGYITLYGHFATLLVKPGQRVKRGQTLGVSGNSGHSTGPHLHFTVFHNCTPTDPYGWAGRGSDPLEAYQGETSTALWVHLPLILNPLPGWFVTDAVPPQDTARLILLRLPPTSEGVEIFTTRLLAEMRAAQAAIEPGAVVVRTDIFRGGLIVNGPISAARLYVLPDVASLASPDASGVEVDVLSSLADASLAKPRPGPAVGGPTWSGYLIRWQGRAVLVGRRGHGLKTGTYLWVGSHRLLVHQLGTASTTGAYAADLGPMSPRDVASLVKKSRRREQTNSPPSGGPVGLPSGGRKRKNANIPLLIPASVAFVLLAAAAVVLRVMNGNRRMRGEE